MVASTPTDNRTLAAAELGVGVDAPVQQVRAVFLSRLGAGHLPPEARVAAVHTLTGILLPVTDDHHHAESTRLAAEIEEFAGCYWSLIPDERRARIAGFESRCTSEAIAARLRHLKIGVDVVPVPRLDEDEQTIVESVCDWYVQPPRQRAIARTGFLIEIGGIPLRFRQVVAAAHTIRCEVQEIVDLDPVLFETLISEGWKRDDYPRAIAAEGPMKVTVTSDAARATSDPAPRNTNGINGYWVLFVIVIVLGRVLAAVSSSNSSTKPIRESYPDPKPAFDVKSLNLYKEGFSVKEILDCLAYERDRSRPQPMRYPEWVVAGKPGLGPSSRMGVRPTYR